MRCDRQQTFALIAFGDRIFAQALVKAKGNATYQSNKSLGGSNLLVRSVPGCGGDANRGRFATENLPECCHLALRALYWSGPGRLHWVRCSNVRSAPPNECAKNQTFQTTNSSLAVSVKTKLCGPGRHPKGPPVRFVPWFISRLGKVIGTTRCSTGDSGGCHARAASDSLLPTAD